MSCKHIPVLLDEVLKCTEDIDENSCMLDCTLGFAGHSKAMLENTKNTKLIACDKDDEAISFAKEELKNFKDRVKIFNSDFKDIFKKLNTDEIKSLRLILADIGLSSYQLDKDERGFSIRSNFLDMRMDTSLDLDAKTVINTYSKEQLAELFINYAQLKDAKNLAEKICAYRQKHYISSAKELAQLIGNEKLKNRSILKSVLVFQALRIEVNQELKALQELLETVSKAGLRNCKLLIISFHSLEDALVKTAFKKWAKSCICDENLYKCVCGNNHSLGKIINKKPLVASSSEIKMNSRSSCAKMRVFHFI